MNRREWQPWAGTPENYKLSIADLVQNGTMNAEIAGTLWAAVDEKLSFLTVAVPQNAGKTTVASAVLALRPPEVDLHFVLGHSEELQTLARDARGGYIVVGEFSHAPMPSYIWGDAVRNVFSTLAAGYSLQTSLHAPGVEAAVDVITTQNRVPDADASALDLIAYIEVFRTGDGGVARRVTEVYELDRIEGGRPIGRTLFRWRRETDTFDKLSEPQNFAHGGEKLAQRRGVIQALVNAGRTSIDDVADAVESFRSA
jgi:type IV secretory pathway ATPase VirB11/archaellum biosynthesis ATPase